MLATVSGERASDAQETNAASFGEPAARLSALEPKVARLTAENAVLNPQNAYGYYVHHLAPRPLMIP